MGAGRQQQNAMRLSDGGKPRPKFGQHRVCLGKAGGRRRGDFHLGFQQLALYRRQARANVVVEAFIVRRGVPRVPAFARKNSSSIPNR
jgi:hypothetical protein